MYTQSRRPGPGRAQPRKSAAATRAICFNFMRNGHFRVTIIFASHENIDKWPSVGEWGVDSVVYGHGQMVIQSIVCTIYFVAIGNMCSANIFMICLIPCPIYGPTKCQLKRTKSIIIMTTT